MILQENFESLSATQALPKGWTQFSTDGDAYGWAMNAGMADLTCGGRGGGRCIASASYAYDDGALHPDNYLVTPMLTDAAKVVYYVCAQDVTAIQEHYAVMASTTNDNPENFSIVFEETGTELPFIKGSESQSEWIERVVMLPEGTQHIAFCHFNCTDQNYVLLDDIKVYRGIATRVNDLHTDSASSIEGYYDLMGRKFDAMQPGINIVKLKNGQVHKLFQK